MPAAKLVSMRDAIARVVTDGATVCMGTALEAAIPFAAGHEIIRQGRRDLTLVGPISDMLFDQLIGAGAAARVIAAWVGNVSAGLGHNYRRATEQGDPRPLAVADHSNLTLSLALLAGSLGVPYVPTRSVLGSDIPTTNDDFRHSRDPWTGAPLLLVPALRPDVTIVHVQRADAEGHCHAWGPLGVTREAVLAARQVLVVAEEVWPTERVLADPNLVLLPAFRVAAVVHEPWGALPSPLQGYYGRDHERFTEYHAASATAEGFRAWLDRWVLGVGDHAGFLKLLGPERLAELRPRRRRPSEPLDYGP